MRIQVNSFIGLASLFAVFITAAASLDGELSFKAVLWGIYATLFLISFIVMDKILCRKVAKNGDFWLMFAPFALLLIFVRLVLGWDLIFAVVAAGYIALAVDCTGRLCAKKKKGSVIFAVDALIFGDFAAFAILSAVGGVRI